MNSLKISVVLVLVFARTAWAVETAPMEIADEVTVAQGGNEFAADLYARLSSDKTVNLFFSPYSISAALAMTYAGAEGRTEKQMAQVLHFSLPEAKLHRAFNQLRQLLDSKQENPEFQLRVANRLWGQKGIQFLPEFLQVTNANYGADLGLLDFKQAESSRRAINSWVEDQTEKKINDLLGPNVLDADTRLVLTNVIYFKASWRHQFSKESTTDAPFHVSSASQEMVPTMHQIGQFNYGTFDQVQVLELPYGLGNLSMVILLPKKSDGLAALENELTGENIKKWTTGLRSKPVSVFLPKFKMTSTFDLADVLRPMGMELAFSERADFTGMSSDEKLFFSAVIHRAFVDLNEEGTEAAAATAVGRPRGTGVEFHADHPFVFLIRERRTGSILFLGRLANPRE